MTTAALIPTLTPTTVIDRGGVQALTIGAMKERVALVLELMANVLEEGKDYGRIPGTDKPTLYKPGAEKLCLAFQLAPEEPRTEDLSTDDQIRYRLGVPITAPHGRLLAVGVGEASTNEEKYRWKKPVCDEEWDETPAHLRREKWFKGKAGAYKGKQVRTSPADLANTALKMAHKRALVHGVLLATGASSVFNQDLEDFEQELRESIIAADDVPTAPAKTPQRASATGAKAASRTSGPKLPDHSTFVTGLVEKVWRPKDKKFFAVKLKGSDRLYTNWFDRFEAVEKDAKAFEGTDHTVKLAIVESKGDKGTFYNVYGVSIADAEPTPRTVAGPAAEAPDGSSLLTADDIFGRQHGEDG